MCEEGATSVDRLVPAAIVEMSCYAFRPEVDASCQHGLPERTGLGLVTVNHGNWVNGTYPPLFYATFGVFASENIALSIAAIRLANSLIVTIMLTATMLLLPRRLQPILGLSTTLTMVPLGLFVLSSTNPSSWALLSAAVIFPAFFALSEARGWRQKCLLAIVALGVLFGAGARADAAVFAALAATMAWFLSTERSRVSTISLITIWLISAAVFLTSGQSEAVGGLGEGQSGASSSGLTLTLQNLVQLPTLWLGMYNNLGWLDTLISPLALFAVVFSALGVLYASLGTLSVKKGAALAAMCLAILVLPLYMLDASNASVGSQVQPRYLLPLYVILIAVAVTPVARPLDFSPAQLSVLVVFVSGAQAVALQDQLTRYVAGNGPLNLSNGAWWWSGLPFPPVALLAIASLSFTTLIVVLACTMHGRRDTTTAQGCLNH